jgi:REP element-mobilizing transposase RayT
MVVNENTVAIPTTFLTREEFDFVRKLRGAYLPHWTLDGAIYHVVFRLNDSIPMTVREEFLKEKQHILELIKDPETILTKYEKCKLVNLYSGKIDSQLDNGYGSCWLRNVKIGNVVKETLELFSGNRYNLFAWCVMPNHVHAIIQPLPGFGLSKILHSWKSYTAHEANKILGRQGKFWHKEYYDRIMRSEESLRNNIDYVYLNPDKAGLCNWGLRWRRETEC